VSPDARRPDRRGWIVVGASGGLTGIGHGFVAFAVSILLKPIAADLDLGRAAVSTAIGLGRLVSGLSAPLVGRAVDSLPPARVIAAGMVLTAAGLVAMRFVEGETGLYLAWSLLVSLGVATGFTIALDKVVISVVRQGRGMALAVRFSIAAIVTTGLMPLVAAMVETLGWRVTCLVWAGVVLLLLPVPLLLFARARPPAEPPGTLSRSGLRQAVATRAYWIIAAAFMAQAAVTMGLSVHMIALITDRGLDAELAAGLFAGLILLSVPVRLVAGWLADRLAPARLPRLLAGLMLAEAVAIAGFALAPSLVTMLTLIAALGVAAGAPTLIVLILLTHLFSARGFGTVQGSLMLLQIPGTVTAPILAGLAYDETGSYAIAIAGFALLLAATGLLLLTLRVPAAGVAAGVAAGLGADG